MHRWRGHSEAVKRAEGSHPHTQLMPQGRSVVHHPVRGPSPSSQARDDTRLTGSRGNFVGLIGRRFVFHTIRA